MTVCGNDDERPLGGDRLAQVIGIIGVSAMTTSAGNPSIKAAACGASPFWPAVRMNRTGHPKPRTAIWISVLRPPRERPSA